MARFLAFLAGGILLAAAPAYAQPSEETQQNEQDMGSGSCVYDGQSYPDRSQLCQDGTLVQCDQGAWGEVGDCSGDGGGSSGSDEDGGSDE